jgi:hypothetical protein
MVDVDQQDQVDLLRQVGIVARPLEGDDVVEVLALGAVAQVADHVRFDVDTVDAAGGEHASEPHREVTGARTEVRYDGIGRKRERAQHIVGFLPDVALRIVEHLRPAFGVAEAMTVRRRRLRECGRRGQRSAGGEAQRGDENASSRHVSVPVFVGQ